MAIVLAGQEVSEDWMRERRGEWLVRVGVGGGGGWGFGVGGAGVFLFSNQYF